MRRHDCIGEESGLIHKVRLVLCLVKREWYIVKWVASNLFLFVVAFFLTTPAEVVSQLDKVLITILGPSASTKVGHQSPVSTVTNSESCCTAHEIIL